MRFSFLLLLLLLAFIAIAGGSIPMPLVRVSDTAYVIFTWVLAVQERGW